MMRNNNLTKNKRVPTPARGTGLNDISHLSRSDFRKGFPFDILCSPASNKSQWNQQKSYSFVSGGGGGGYLPNLPPKNTSSFSTPTYHRPNKKAQQSPLPLQIPQNLTSSPLKIGQLCHPQKRNESFSQLGVGCVKITQPRRLQPQALTVRSRGVANCRRISVQHRWPPMPSWWSWTPNSVVMMSGKPGEKCWIHPYKVGPKTLVIRL